MAFSRNVCVLCGSVGSDCKANWDMGYYKVDCKVINKFMKISTSVTTKYEKEWHILAGLISHNLPNNSVVEMSDADVLMDRKPNLGEQLDEILMFVEKNSPDPLSLFVLKIFPFLVYCSNVGSVEKRCGTLEEEGLIKYSTYRTPIELALNIRLTAKGAERLIEASSSRKNPSNKVFVALQFKGDYASKIRDGAKKGCAEKGLIAATVDEADYTGDITDRIISEINQSRYVIADYTFGNRGVYYEAGYARGKGIEVIETCNEAWRKQEIEAGRKPLHFDVEHRNIILWTTEEELTERISNRIGALQ